MSEPEPIPSIENPSTDPVAIASLADSDNELALAVESRRCTLMQTPLRKYFEAAVKFEASDLLLRGGQVPRLRLRGSLQALKVDALDAQAFESSVIQSLTPVQRRAFLTHGSIDLGLDLEGEVSSRFRINIFRTRGRTALAARRVNAKVLDFQTLMLPAVLGSVAMLHQGLVLVSGVTGCGKSTTLASMIQHINQNRSCHILTIEDPIEYLFADGKAIVNQREVGMDVPDFGSGLKALVRENPDVVLIGEMRDKETFEAALRAAETGHLVFGTIHASSAAQAFGRIYDLFPPDERAAIRTMLAFQMQAFVYQRLLPTLKQDMQVVPAVEVLLQSPATRKYILDGREHELNDVIKENRQAGMQTFADSLVDLVNRQLVHPKVAMAHANSPEEIKMRLRGISSE